MKPYSGTSSKPDMWKKYPQEPEGVEKGMKVSEIDKEKVKLYLRIEDTTDFDDELIEAILESAKSYVENYTGLPMVQTEGVGNYLDEYPEVSVAVLVLCQDMYDNRSMYVEKSNVNRVVDSILCMHCRNLV